MTIAEMRRWAFCRKMRSLRFSAIISTALRAQYGVTDLGVFGSVAHDEAHPDSDVDIVVRMREPKLFFMVHIKDTLDEVFQRPVDIIQYRETMNPFLKKRIDRDAVYV